MDRSVALHERSFVTALDIYGVAIRAVFNALNKEREKGLRPRLLVLDGAPSSSLWSLSRTKLTPHTTQVSRHSRRRTSRTAATCLRVSSSSTSTCTSSSRRSSCGARSTVTRQSSTSTLLRPVRCCLSFKPAGSRSGADLERLPLAEELIRRRHILEGDDRTPISYNIELASTANPDSGAVSYTFTNAWLQAPAHAAHAPRLPADIVQGLRRLDLDRLHYLAVNPTQIAFESLVYLSSLEPGELDSPDSWIFFFLLRVIAAFHHESPADMQHWLDPAAWYACAIAASKDELVALMHGVRRLRTRTLATKMAE